MERIISKRTLREFWIEHPDSEQYLKSWYDTTIRAEWENLNDIKKSFSFVSILNDNRVVFNIKGNSYRLIVKFNFEKSWGFIRFIGTHSQYDKIDANTI